MFHNVEKTIIFQLARVIYGTPTPCSGASHIIASSLPLLPLPFHFQSYQFLNSHSATELEGVVIKCLSKQYSVPKRLSDKCAAEIKIIIEESAKDVRQDYVLYKACEKDIQSLCGEWVQADGEDSRGRVEECLKSRLKDIASGKCRREVADLLREAKVDIDVDPLLHTACALDLKRHCPDVQSGDGQQVQYDRSNEDLR